MKDFGIPTTIIGLFFSLMIVIHAVSKLQPGEVICLLTLLLLAAIGGIFWAADRES